MRLMPVSIERIIAENRLTNAVFRRTWSWKDYTFQYMYILAIITILFVFDYNMRIFWAPLWVYGYICIMYISVRIAFNITSNKESAELEDELIKCILYDKETENEVYSRDEIKERLLLESHINKFRMSIDRVESW